MLLSTYLWELIGRCWAHCHPYQQRASPPNVIAQTWGPVNRATGRTTCLVHATEIENEFFFNVYCQAEFLAIYHGHVCVRSATA